MPITAVAPSSSGSPAATSAPNAISRITSVIGSERNSAFWKSSSNASPISFSADASPNSPITTSGCCFCSAATAASGASTASLAVSSSPGSSKLTSTERPSSETLPAFSGTSGLSTSLTPFVASSLVDDVVDRGGELRITDLEPVLALDEHGLAGLVGEAGGLDDLVAALGLAVAGVLVGERLVPDHPAEHGGEDHEGEPAEDGLLAVLRAPAAGARSETLRLHSGEHLWGERERDLGSAPQRAIKHAGRP